MRNLLPFITFLAILTAQDEVNNKVITDHYYYPTDGLTKIVVDISYSLGESVIYAGKEGDGITGKIRYEPRIQQPIVSFSRAGNVGYFELDMKSHKHKVYFNELDDFENRNSLELFFPVNIPHEINFELGLGEADLDLTGLSIESLNIQSGMADFQINVGSANPLVCSEFTVANGIGDFSGRNLGNLRAQSIDIEVGLGSMDLDFTGDVIEDFDLDAEVGLGSLDIILPKNINGYASVSKSFLSSVSIPRGFSDEKLPGRKTVHLNFDVGVGSIDVSQR